MRAQGSFIYFDFVMFLGDDGDGLVVFGVRNKDALVDVVVTLRYLGKVQCVFTHITAGSNGAVLWNI
jgi:hypothetical protein